MDVQAVTRAGLSTCTFEVHSETAGDHRIALFDHPTTAYRHAQDYRRMVQRMIGAKVRVVAVPRRRA